MVFANNAGSQHLNISPEKNETDENFVSDKKLPGEEVRPNYLNQVNTIKKIILLFDTDYLLHHYLSVTGTSGLFVLDRASAFLIHGKSGQAS